MGFIQAIKGSIKGTFAEQWQEFFVPQDGLPATVGLYPAVLKTSNAGRGENKKLSENIITNGSRIVVPEGTALVTVVDGKITGCITEAGAYTFESDNPNSKSFFHSGDGIIASTIGQAWDRFKFAGIPASEQLAFYVNTKPITGNKFGTQTPIYWQDTYLATRAGGSARGTYALQIVDPILFFQVLVPDVYKRPNAPIFDFADMDNPAGDHLFNDFITCLTGAFKRFSLLSGQNQMDTIDFIQANLDKFAVTMDEEVENTYQWSTNYGLKVISVNLQADYDAATLAILEEARKDDMEIRKATRMGAAYSNNMTGMMGAATGQAMQGAANNEGGAMMGFMGMNLAQQNGANLMGAVQNAAPAQEDPFETLSKFKKMLDAGLITQEDYDAKKKQILG